jgi:arsenate reductase (glutaredoxin)
MADEVCVWFNPRCSKCRGAKEILDERGVDASYLHYLDDTPDRAEIERVLGLLGEDDPRAMMRTGEDVYRELGGAPDPDRAADRRQG